jgi:transcriptional regulator with XRE-family HTH domain
VVEGDVSAKLAQLGARIREARTARGVTQAELAEQAGIQRETLDRFATGGGNDLSMAGVLLLLDLLDLEMTVQNDPRARPDVATALDVDVRPILSAGPSRRD